MDEKLDVVSAMQRINHSEEATAKRLYPISPKRIGAQAFCMEAYRLTTTESPTGILIPRTGPLPFRYPYANYIPRAVDPSAEGEQSSEAINPGAYFPVSDEPQNDPSQYYKAYYMKHKAIERHNKSMEKWGDRAHYTQEEHDISETDTTVQESTQGMAPELGEEPAQNSTDKKKKTKNKKTGGGVEKRAKKAIMRMQESPETSGTETTAPKLSGKKKGKKTGGGKEGRVKKAALRM